MNFYSENIINKIIDSEDVENILDKIDTFYQELTITLTNRDGRELGCIVG
jgi:uncharacterized protein YlzI (FlbEa/FlbD family)